VSPQRRAFVCGQQQICVLGVSDWQLSVGSFVVMAPHQQLWPLNSVRQASCLGSLDRVRLIRHGVGLVQVPCCVHVRIHVVVMWLVLNLHGLVVAGTSPVFSAPDLVQPVGSDLYDWKGCSRSWVVVWTRK